MAQVSTESIARSGLNATYNAASAGGDKFPPGDRTFLHVKNGSAGAVTVTVATPNKLIGLDLADVAVSVPAGEDRFIGPFPTQHFAGSDGLADVTWSATASVTFAVAKA